MSRRIIHEKYHSGVKLQKRIVDENNFTYRQTLYFINRYFKSKNKILDIGSGVGTVDFYLAKKGCFVTGIDISSKAVKTAERNAEILGVSAKVKFLILDFPSNRIRGKYDGLVITEVLEHLKNDTTALQMARRMLVKGSIVIASSPSINAPLYKMGLLKDFDKRVGHLRRYSEKNFRHIFESCGFKIIEFKKTEGILRNFLFTNRFAGMFVRFIRGPICGFVTFIDNLLIPVFGESNFYIIASKK